VNIERTGQLSHAALAEKVGLDRTTLTRNLRPLTRAKWFAAAIGQDRRQHLLQLTTAGRRKLVRSLPLWEEAQQQFLSQIGTEPLQELQTLLTAAESAVTKAYTANQENRKPAGMPLSLQARGLSACAGQAFVPPSTVKLAPVMYEDSGPATNATNAATSSTCP
jgi:DNA-binding MarR family transcriptional regulator